MFTNFILAIGIGIVILAPRYALMRFVVNSRPNPWGFAVFGVLVVAAIFIALQNMHR